MSDAKTTEASPAIEFKCAYCGAWNYATYSLDRGLVNGKLCLCDIIECEHCGNDNRVIEKIWHGERKRG